MANFKRFPESATVLGHFEKYNCVTDEAVDFLRVANTDILEKKGKLNLSLFLYNQEEGAHFI